LRTAIESILKQSYENFELLIADDGSKDSCEQIVQNFKRHDKRIRFWQNPKQLGLFGNYNNCFYKASGELIKPMAQDDVLSLDTLENMVQAIDKNANCVLVAVGKQKIDEHGRVFDTEASNFEPGSMAGRRASLLCMATYRNLIGEPAAVLFRKAAGRTAFDTNYHSLGDLDFWLRLLKNGNFSYINQVGVSFRSHKDSETTRLLKNMNWVVDFVRLSHQHKDLVTELGLNEDEYLMGAVKQLGIFVESLVASQTINKETLDFEQTDGFKELAFYCLRALGQIEPERIILKDKCEGMKRSASWKITKPLRLAKAKITHLPLDVVD
jgi:glycosyltransferase involved in cell wall biosynthesis